MSRTQSQLSSSKQVRKRSQRVTNKATHCLPAAMQRPASCLQFPPSFVHLFRFFCILTRLSWAGGWRCAAFASRQAGAPQLKWLRERQPMRRAGAHTFLRALNACLTRFVFNDAFATWRRRAGQGAPELEFYRTQVNEQRWAAREAGRSRHAAAHCNLGSQ